MPGSPGESLTSTVASPPDTEIPASLSGKATKQTVIASVLTTDQAVCFPDYSLPDPTGTVRTLSELRGRDPLILLPARGNDCAEEHLKPAANYPKVAVADNRDALQGADAVVLALRFTVLKGVIDEIAGPLSGKLVVVPSNPLTATHEVTSHVSCRKGDPQGRS